MSGYEMLTGCLFSRVIGMLLLDLLPSKLILILNFEIFQTNSNDDLRWTLKRVLLDQNRWT